MLVTVDTHGAPRPVGHYAQAVCHNGVVYVSSCLPLRAGEAPVPPGTIEEQTALALDNLRTVLLAAGSDLDSVLKLTWYISDMSLYQRADAVIAEYFGDHRPARTVVGLPQIHFGALVKIDAIAAIVG